MRTTVELPPELLREATSVATARGETLAEFVTRAVSHELGDAVAASPRDRVVLPLVGETPDKDAVELTNAGIEATFEAEDVERHGRR